MFPSPQGGLTDGLAQELGTFGGVGVAMGQTKKWY
jgi:hypothetical protein